MSALGSRSFAYRNTYCRLHAPHTGRTHRRIPCGYPRGGPAVAEVRRRRRRLLAGRRWRDRHAHLRRRRCGGRFWPGLLVRPRRLLVLPGVLPGLRYLGRHVPRCPADPFPSHHRRNPRAAVRPNVARLCPGDAFSLGVLACIPACGWRQIAGGHLRPRLLAGGC